MEKEMMDFDPNIPQPDPQWDYYDLWKKTYFLKVTIDNLFLYLASIEKADNSTDSRLRTKYNDISALADACDEYLEDCSDFYE